jgi:Protein of unknown function (DUF3999)
MEVRRLVKLRAIALVCAVGIFGFTSLGATAFLFFPHGWSHWRYSRQIITEPFTKFTLIRASLPEEVYSHAKNELADLRIVDDQGKEVPYALDVPSGGTRVERHNATMREQSFIPGEASQFVLDDGVRPEFHNAIEIATPDTDFITWAEVAVSDDAREWRIVCDRAPLFRFLSQDLQGTQTLHYSETNARFIRLRVLDGTKKFLISSVEVLYEVSTPAERRAISYVPAPAASAKAGQSIWQADLPAEIPVSEVHFETDEPEFSRSVTVETSSDGAEWEQDGGGEIYRFRRDDAQREWLQVGLPDTWSNHWRVHVANGNNSPLANARVTLYMTPRRIVFRYYPNRRYYLLYGQSEAKPPQYDLARTLHVGDAVALPGATFGPEETNAAYEDPRPWTERHPAALWASVILAAILLGIAALRSLSASSSRESS